MVESTRPVAVVTGGSRGIGAAIVLRLARSGYDVVATYRVDSAAAARVTAAAPRDSRVEFVQADLETNEGVDAPFLIARERFNRLDALVNNAGISTRYAALADTPTDEVRRTVTVNFTAAVLSAQWAVREFLRLDAHGTIVNITSGAATLGSPGEYVHYAAAKAGLDAFTMGLGKEVGQHGIRVVGLAPGLVSTDLHATTGDPERPIRMAADIPLRRAAEPDEIATTIHWLLSPDASYITATTLRVAGGR